MKIPVRIRLTLGGVPVTPWEDVLFEKVDGAWNQASSAKWFGTIDADGYEAMSEGINRRESFPLSMSTSGTFELSGISL